VSLISELGSLGSTLDEVIGRIAAMADDLIGGPDDAIGGSLTEVERSLRAGSRRLERLRKDLER
jgi:hypothetical protein